MPITVAATGLEVAQDGGAFGRGVVWMPAHTAASSVGHAECGDGSVLTADMRQANDRADELAKRAAAGIRVSEGCRAGLKEQFLEARALAVFLGRLTHAAATHMMPDGRVARDSSGHIGPPARRRAARPARADPLSIVGPPARGDAFARSPIIAAISARMLQRIRGQLAHGRVGFRGVGAWRWRFPGGACN